jgi:hypothetical protein
VVTEVAAGLLLESFPDVSLAPVECVSSPQVGRLPLEEVAGWSSEAGFKEIWVDVVVDLDSVRSTGGPDPERTCERCGVKEWFVTGVESIESRWAADVGDVIHSRLPRLNGAGIFVSATQLRGVSFFFVRELYGWVFCTDKVKKFIDDAGFTNVDFLEYGETL